MCNNVQIYKNISNHQIKMHKVRKKSLAAHKRRKRTTLIYKNLNTSPIDPRPTLYLPTLHIAMIFR